MSRRCDICGRGPKKAARRSHSKIKTNRRQHVNLQKHEDKKVCTNCIRTMTKKIRLAASK